MVKVGLSLQEMNGSLCSVLTIHKNERKGVCVCEAQLRGHCWSAGYISELKTK